MVSYTYLATHETKYVHIYIRNVYTTYTSLFDIGGFRSPVSSAARCRLVILGDAGSTFRQGSYSSMPGGLSTDEATLATVAHPCALAF